MFLNHVAARSSTALCCGCCGNVGREGWVFNGKADFFMERQGSLKRLFEDKVPRVDLSVHYQAVVVVHACSECDLSVGGWHSL